MKIRMWTGMRKRPIGFVAIIGLDNSCNAKLQKGFWLDNRIQIHRNIKQDFSVRFFELERKLCERNFFTHVDLAVRVHRVDIPISRRRHIEFPVALLILNGDEEFKTGCFPQVILARGEISRRWQKNGICFTGNSITDGELILHPFDFTCDLYLCQVTCWIWNEFKRFHLSTCFPVYLFT